MIRLIKINVSAFVLCLTTLTSCMENSISDSEKINTTTEVIHDIQESFEEVKTVAEEVLILENNYQKIKLSKGINTKQDILYLLKNKKNLI